MEVHHPADGVAARSATEAFVALHVGGDVEGGGLFVMERTVRAELGTGAAEGDHGVDQIDDVGLGEDEFLGLWRYGSHWGRSE